MLEQLMAGLTRIAGVLLTAVKTLVPVSAGQAQLEALLKKQVEEQHLPGVAAVVVRSSGMVASASAGVKRIGENSWLEPTDVLHLGSNTKAITATTIARLVASGRLSWTATPVEVLPELSAEMHPAYKQVTLEQLLSHHAGVPPYTNPRTPFIRLSSVLRCPAACQSVRMSNVCGWD